LSAKHMHVSYDALVLCLLVCMLSLPKYTEACADLLASIQVTLPVIPLIVC